MAWAILSVGDDLFATATLNEYIQEISQRNYPGSPFPSVIDGDDVQDWHFWEALQSATAALMGNEWLPTDTVTAGSHDPILTAADVIAAVLPLGDWTRKYPREYANAAATTYTDGNAFANGHNARNRETGKVMNRAAGAWVLAPGTPPDTVTTSGLHQAEDYIGHWILNEIQAWLCMLKHRLLTGGPQFLIDTYEYYVGESDPLGSFGTIAAAQADATANYALGGTGPGVVVTGISAFTTNSGGGGSFSASAVRERAKIHYGTAAFDLTSTVKYYLMSGAPASGSFDANGDPFVDGVAVLVATVSKPASAQPVTDWIGQAGIPNWDAGGANVGYIAAYLGSFAIETPDYSQTCDAVPGAAEDDELLLLL